MNKDQILIGMIVEESITFKEVCQRYNIPRSLLNEMIEYGIFPHSSLISQGNLSNDDLQRIESAFRLHRDLEINLPGVALALELLDQIADLKKELEILNKHF